MHSLFLTDLDGTLLQSDQTIGARTRDALELLAERDVVRVVATGRSLHSARRVLDREAPIDYLIFSSGAGLLDWGHDRGPGRAEKLLLAHTMQGSDIERAARYLLREDMDVMIHRPAPDSHCFGWLAAAGDGDAREGGEDLRTRVKGFPDSAWPLVPASEHRVSLGMQGVATGWTGPASMVLGVADVENPDRTVARAREALPDLQVIRTTSPINGRSLWLEIVPTHVSKASAGQWLADHLGIEHARTFAIGNDYNDEALLAWASESAVVAGAPETLRAQFTEVAGNDRDGVAEAIERFGL